RASAILRAAEEAEIRRSRLRSDSRSGTCACWGRFTSSWSTRLAVRCVSAREPRAPRMGGLSLRAESIQHGIGPGFDGECFRLKSRHELVAGQRAADGSEITLHVAAQAVRDAGSRGELLLGVAQ